MEGWLKLHRSLALHDMWTAEPFTRGQAWVDLLMLANHAPGIVRKQGLRIDLERGDVGWSEIELAARWKWSRGKVRRFLDELKNEEMVCRKSVQKTDEKQDRRKFVITILNYDRFQQFDEANSTSDGTSDGQATDKRRYKNKNDKNERRERNIRQAATHPEYAAFAMQFQTAAIDMHGKIAPAISESLINSAVDSIDKLVRIDGFTFEQVRDAMGWAAIDDFWSKNALSLAGLRTKNGDGRTKFQKILAAMDKKKPATDNQFAGVI